MKEFRINDYISLNLEDFETNININREIFTCNRFL